MSNKGYYNTIKSLANSQTFSDPAKRS